MNIFDGFFITLICMIDSRKLSYHHHHNHGIFQVQSMMTMLISIAIHPPAGIFISRWQSKNRLFKSRTFSYFMLDDHKSITYNEISVYQFPDQINAQCPHYNFPREITIIDHKLYIYELSIIAFIYVYSGVTIKHPHVW